MQLLVRMFGREVLAVEARRGGDSADADEPEAGPPFGFTGGAGGQAEAVGVDPWESGEVIARG